MKKINLYVIKNSVLRDFPFILKDIKKNKKIFNYGRLSITSLFLLSLSIMYFFGVNKHLMLINTGVFVFLIYLMYSFKEKLNNKIVEKINKEEHSYKNLNIKFIKELEKVVG